MGRKYCTVDSIKELYDSIISKKPVSQFAVLSLENVTGYSFATSKDFRERMGLFLKKHYYKGNDLKKAREWSEMEQKQVAEWLGVSERRVKQMESSRKPLSQDAVSFIKVMGFTKKVPLRKAVFTPPEPKGRPPTQKRVQSPKRISQDYKVTDLEKCGFCGIEKPPWEITVTRVGLWCEYICEECLKCLK